jgi:hypothetical protein
MMTIPPELSPELALLLGNAIRQRDRSLLREVISKMSVTLDDVDARWAFRITQGSLSTDDHVWFEGEIREMRGG